MSAEEFKTEATSRGLDEATITLVVDKHENEESLSNMTKEQLNSLELEDKQRKALQAWLVDLYVQYNREDNTAAMKDTGVDKVDGPDPGLSDYAEASPPKPSSYDRCTNVGIVGQVGAGCSSLINALRGLEPDSPEAASTKIGEEHTGLQPYNMLKVDKMMLWDVPAVQDKSEDYLKTIELDRYDAVVVCSSERLSELDVWVAGEANKAGVRTFVVRTKIDRDVESDKEDYEDKHDEEALLERIRKDIEGQVEDVTVYLVSSKKSFWDKWDLEKLSADLATVVQRPRPAEAVVEAITTPETKPKTDEDPNEITEVAPKDKIESMAAKFKEEIPSVVSKAAKKIDMNVLTKQINEYKKEFGVENIDPPEDYLNSLKDTVNRYKNKTKPKGFVATITSCFGGRSNAAKDSEDKEKAAEEINDAAPVLLENAIDGCKKAALAKLNVG